MLFIEFSFIFIMFHTTFIRLATKEYYQFMANYCNIHLVIELLHASWSVISVEPIASKGYDEMRVIFKYFSFLQFLLTLILV